MQSPDRGVMLDLVKGAAATLALFLAYVFLPLAGFVPGIFTPLPAMFYALKNGRNSGLAIVLVTSVSLAVMTNPAITALYFFQGGMLSLALPFFLLKGWGGARSIAFSVGVTFLFLLLVVACAWQFFGVDVNGMLLKGIDSSVSQTVAIYDKSGLEEDDLNTLREGVKQLGEIVRRIYPALALIALGFVAAINLLALNRVTKKIDCQLQMGELSAFRNPDHLIWFVIAPGFAFVAGNTHVATAALNVLVVTLTMYSIQGLAVVMYYFERLSVPGFIRVTFYIMLALQPYLAAVLAVLGVFDLWGNFRVPRQQKNL